MRAAECRVGQTVERRDRLGEWLIVSLDGDLHVKVSPLDPDVPVELGSVPVSQIRPTWETPAERLARGHVR